MMATAKMLICNDHLNEKEKKLVKKRCKRYQNFDDQQIEALVNNINEYYLSQLIKDDDFYKARHLFYFLSFYKFSTLVKKDKLSFRD